MLRTWCLRAPAIVVTLPMPMRRLLPALLFVLALAPAAQAATTSKPWPPAGGSGDLFIHYGEEHWNDEDGLTLLPKIISESTRYKPGLVTMSGDKDNDGTTEQLTMWRNIMGAYEAARVPYFPSVGNHDRMAPNGVPPGTGGLFNKTLRGTVTNYKSVFAGRPYPFGDAAPYRNSKFAQRSRPASDPAGASTHYFVDYGKTRWIFIDNSCWGIRDCDDDQNPSFPDAQGNTGQFQFLERAANEARSKGMTAFAVMHLPTQDPRDQSYTDTTAFNHVMGKGLNPSQAPDNDAFEEIAQRTGIDGVFTGHIKGQFLYRGRGGVPYYIDGGAGGELYTTGPVGADHGYWHGFRLVRVSGGRVTTDTVPIFVKDGIRLEGPGTLNPGRQGQFEAFGRQPVFKDPAQVPSLELRDPDPRPPASSSGLGGFIRGGGWLFVPVILLVLGGMAMNGTLRAPRRRPLVVVCAAAGVGLIGVAGASLAQQSEPTATPRASLPTPAHIFTSSNPQVVAPLKAKGDDPRRDAATQTEGGLFAARCPGRARVSITSGFETTAKTVLVPSKRGRIARRVRAIRARGLRPRVRRTVARVRLSQPARVLVRVRRRGRTVRVLRDACLNQGSKRLRVAWDARARRRGKLRAVRPGRYRIQVYVRSDRRTIARGATVRVGR